MRKIFCALLIFCFFTFPAYGAFTGTVPDEYSTITELIEEYAAQFNEDEDDEDEDEDVTQDTEIVITLSSNYNMTSEGTVTIDSTTCPSLTSFTLNGGGYTLTNTNGRHFEINYASVPVTFNGITLNGGSAGGGININAAAAVVFNNFTASNNRSAQNGGAVYIASASSVTFDNVTTLTGNTSSSGNGGGIYSTPAITFSGTSTFTSNTAGSGNGGAVYSGAGVTFSDMATFTGNIANNGGGVYATGAATFSKEVRFVNNRAVSGSGGAVYAGGALTFSDVGTFNSNTATSNGGAIFDNAGAITFSTNPTFESNTASASGGAIYTGNGFTMSSGGTFTANTATQYGGAIYSAGGTVALTSVNFGSDSLTGNSAKNGGAVYIAADTANFNAVNFEQNSGDLGGAIYASGTANINTGTKFTNNKANSGGAVYSVGGTATLTGAVSFTSNTANYYGGAVAVYSRGKLNSSANGTYTFTTNEAGTSGGAVIISGMGSSSALLGEIVFDRNFAQTSGGAIYTEDHGNIDGENAEFVFEENEAGELDTSLSDPSYSSTSYTGYGGALYISGNNAVFGESEFLTNSAPYGGAVYVSGGELEFTGSTLFETNAAYSGGAFYSDGGTTNFNARSEFNNNTAQDDGGALYTTGETASVSFNSPTTFTNNKANNDSSFYGGGGAAWLGADGSPFLDSAIFTNNQTLGSNPDYADGSNGGALYLAFRGLFQINATPGYIFNSNRAYMNGGAIYSASTDIEIQNVNISGDNYARYGDGGFIWSGGGCSVTVRNTTVTSRLPNQTKAINGGMIYIDDGGTLNIGGTSSSDAVTFTNGNASKNGGAVFVSESGTLSITNATFSSNNATKGGGAVYIDSGGSMSISSALFSANTAGKGGGAVCVRSSTANINNVIFSGNTANGNTTGTIDTNEIDPGGGAIYLDGTSYTTIQQSTFSGNILLNGPGGAIYANGEFHVYTSLFYGNRADAGSGGGALYMNQFGLGTGKFTAESCMFDSNLGRASSGNVNGGALNLRVDVAEINACTFTNNTLTGSSYANGGALFLYAVDTDTGSKITNSTFTENVTYGSTNQGGAMYLNAGGAPITVESCTITKGNTASNGGQGGGMYVNSGTVSVRATIVVGNLAAGGGHDIWVNNGTTTSGGYNRVGTYGKGTGNTSWTQTVTGAATTDREDENGNWTTAAFFRTNDLASNDTTILGDALPVPLIGSNFDGAARIYLRTILLSDDFSILATDDAATGAIPYAQKYSFLDLDERGVSRHATVNINIDIGAVFSNLLSSNPPPDEQGDVIASIMISGIPNSLRSTGQTASLIAMVFYTNGKTNYGGSSALGFEPVTWRSSAPSIVSVDQSGNIVALRTTYTPDYAIPGSVTIMVQTQRLAASGQYATDSKIIRVTNEYSNLNISPAYNDILSDYVYGIFEYDLSLMLTDASASIVKASSFQNNFKSVWKADEATQITDLTTSTPSFTTSFAYKAGDGYRAAKSAGVNINFSSRANGDVFPLTYSWKFSGDEVKNILGHDLSSANIDDALAEKLFENLKIDFAGTNRNWTVIGSGGVSAAEAKKSGALVLTKSDNNRGVNIELTAYLTNVNATGNGDGAQLVGSSGNNNLLVVPDGLSDGSISGTMWMAVKSSASNPNNNPGSNTDNTNTNSGGDSGGSGGGGGGCNAFGAGMIFAVLAFAFQKKQKI